MSYLFADQKYRHKPNHVAAVVKLVNTSVTRGTWVAQLVKCLILDFGSGHDLTG